MLILLYILATFIPALAVQVRRFHDQNKSGCFALFNLIPYVGGFISLIFMCIDGTAGPNRFGYDPKGRHCIMPITSILLTRYLLMLLAILWPER